MGTKGELPTTFSLTDSSPWLLLARRGANQGLGLSSQQDPVVCSLGNGDIWTWDSRVSDSCSGDSEAHEDLRINNPYFIFALVQDGYSPFQL